MKKVVSGIVLSSVIVFAVGCSNSSSTDNKVNNQPCIPNSELMASGIVGGTQVYESSSDSKNVVMLITKMKDESKVAICTSVALTSRVLLTAAHCVSDDQDASKTIAITRATLSCESGVDVTRDQIKVSKVVRHEGYSATSSYLAGENDLALVFLSTPLSYSYPTYKIADSNLVNSANTLYFWGFGEVNHNAGGSGLLRKTEVSGSQYSILKYDKKVRVDQSYGRGVCSGDSGGPGLVKVNGEYQILGINSYVEGEKESEMCKGQGYLVLADSYKDWIQRKLASRGEKLKN